MAYDSWASQINGMVYNVHFYYLNKKLGEENRGSNYLPFSASGQVLNLIYYPFLEQRELGQALQTFNYDQKYFGTVKPDASSPDQFLAPAPKVYKIYGQVNIQPKELGAFPRYGHHNRQSDKRHWSNESKLLQYPYHFVTINDYINPPLLLENQYIPIQDTTNMITVKVWQPLTMNGGYTIFVDGYKGDKNHGANEGMIANAGLDLPVSSSAYSEFMATSKAQFIAQNEAGSRNEWTNFGRGVVSVIGGGIQAGLGAMAIGASGGSATVLGAGSMMGAGAYAMGQGIMDVVQAQVTQTNRVEQSQAMISDLMNAPRNVSLASSDILMSLKRNEKRVHYNRYMISEYYKTKIADYWHYYGYKQNKLMAINTKNRKYFNYIRTMGANIVSNAMDKTEIEMVKSIYDKGIRFWHAKNGEINKNHDKDNVEV